jgi:LPXTG-motif cell wall-anchored protein
VETGSVQQGVETSILPEISSKVKQTIKSLQEKFRELKPELDAATILPDYLPKTGSKELSWIMLLLVMMMGGYVVARKQR